MPLNPVPIVKALVAIAVTVVDPPKLTELPLMVMLLLASCALLMVPDRAVVGMVVDAVTLLVPLAYMYPVKPVTAKDENDSADPPKTFSHALVVLL